jgi:bacterioferritin (cytochrome b1)
MPDPKAKESEITRERLAELLNEDLSREYQAIIAYVVYSQVLTGAEYMDIAAQLEIHAKQELDHALILSRQIDYLGKMPSVTPKPVRTSKNPKEMLRYDLDNENETVRNYRDRIPQCEVWESTRWRNRFGKSSCRSRTTRSIWPPPLAKKFPMSAAAPEGVPCAKVAGSSRRESMALSFGPFLRL